jgi:hypothetical protein
MSDKYDCLFDNFDKGWILIILIKVHLYELFKAKMNLKVRTKRNL